MCERVGTEGGFLVPEVLRSQVLFYMMTAIVRPQATVLPMSSLRLPVPVLDNPTQSGTTQALGGLTFWFAEEGAAIGNSPGFRAGCAGGAEAGRVLMRCRTNSRMTRRGRSGISSPG